MPRLSLAARAGLAVALMIGFYALALAIVALLLWLVYAQFALIEHFNLKLTIFLVVAAGAILWAILPRIDRFEPPGPTLARERHPRLFDELESVARDTGQDMPREVYLVPDLNAWVSQRGGVMGFGSRRVMGLGLPLLEVLSVSEMRAVIAHEFGHYHGGDTKLGPWIYKTRGAIGRTLQQLSEHAEFLMFPFRWYAKAFLRITHAVSRRQEYAADELAARVSGAGAMSGALRKIHGTAEAFDMYWSSEFVPALNRGFRPPLAAGFRRFLTAPSVERMVGSVVEHELAEGKANPYDTHPSLRERLAALQGLEESSVRPSDDRPALSLLADEGTLESTLIDSMLRDEARGTLAPLAWDDAGERLWLPLWREQIRAHAAELATLTPASLPALSKDLPRLAGGLGIAMSTSAATQEQVGFAVHVVGAALAILLHERGFAVKAPPGEGVRLERGELAVEPFTVMRDLATDALSAEAWRARCEALGIAGVPLAQEAGRSTEPVPAPPEGTSPVSAARPRRDAADSKAP